MTNENYDKNKYEINQITANGKMTLNRKKLKKTLNRESRTL